MPSTPQMHTVVPDAHADSFLKDFVAHHGPIPLLGRTLLAAESAALERGVRLEFSTFQELALVNKANRDSWLPLLPHYDPEKSEINHDNSFCILGRNSQGEIVLTQVARYFNWTDTTLHDEIVNLRLFYKDPVAMSASNEAAFVSAPSAKNIKGRVAFTGAFWCRPDYRGKGFPGITPRIARCLAIARWNVETVCTIMAPDVYQRGVAQRGAYPNAEWEVRLVNSPYGTARMALLWTTRSEMMDDFEHHLKSTDLDAKVAANRGA